MNPVEQDKIELKRIIDLINNNTNVFRCVICKKGFAGYGHNPQPLKSKGRCCDDCNIEVILKRFENLKQNQKK